MRPKTTFINATIMTVCIIAVGYVTVATPAEAQSIRGLPRSWGSPPEYIRRVEPGRFIGDYKSKLANPVATRMLLFKAAVFGVNMDVLDHYNDTGLTAVTFFTHVADRDRAEGLFCRFWYRINAANNEVEIDDDASFFQTGLDAGAVKLKTANANHSLSYGAAWNVELYMDRP